MENRELEFDDIVQSKLGHFAEEITSAGWIAMSKSLDIHMPRTEDQIFDSILRDKVSQVSHDVTSNWPSIDTDLNKIKSTDSQKRFDKIIYNKIGFINYGRGADWGKLSERLEEWDQIRRRLVTSRLVEAFAIIVILLMAYGGFNSLESTHKQEKASTNQNEYAYENAISIKDSAGSKLSSSVDKKDIVDQTSIANIASIKSTSSINNRDRRLIHTLPQESKPLVNKIELDESIVAFNNSVTNKSIDNSPHDNFRTNNDSEVIRANLFILSGLLSRQEHSQFAQTPLEKKSFSPSHDDQYNLNETTPIISLVSDQGFADVWSVGLLVSLDEHYIATPYDFDLGLNALERFSQGYGGSIRFNRKMGNWNIETGLGYHYINYQPKQFSLIDGGSFNHGYELVKHANTKLHFVEIPLEIQHNILTSNRFRLYANVGSSININVASQYTFERTSQDNNARPARILSHAPQSLSSQKDYSSGALEGGSISENSYFTANIGVGLDYRLTDDINVFFQSTYHHRIGQSGIGPNDDLFHLTSFNFGARLPLVKD